jgi:transitional endoplasmic reticulum ATPase
VARPSGFPPDDIEYSARKASQRVLEQSVFESDAVKRKSSTTTTEHYLWAIGDTRRTVSDDVIEEFEVDIERLGRL